MYTKRIIKTLAMKAIPLAAILVVSATPAFAAKYYLSDNNALIKGCSGTIEIKIDTEGANVVAGDSTINIDPNDLTVNQLSIGTPLPMQVFNQIESNQIKLSGARLPMSGNFNGVGTLGYINFTPKDNASSGTFTFAPDLNLDNNMVDENINNVLTQAISKTYTFKDKYNKIVDGVGFCTPDINPPTVQFIYPPAGSSNIPVDSNTIFSISDNRAGVDINTMKFTLDGKDYTNKSADLNIKQDNGIYRIEMNPDKDFKQGTNILMSVNICDLNSPANCTTASANFRTYTPAPPAPVCGDGIVNYQNGEQCDDGNLRSGDGCSILCLYEIPSTGPASCSDGVMNQGEDGIDCGGPCINKACPTCIDGIKNQGEQSVDCGGPCPACGSQPPTQCPATPSDGKKILICHYSKGNKNNPNTIEVSENTWPEHQKHGDTLGECPVADLCSEVLKLAAPEREKEALSQAENVIEQKGVVQEQKSVVVAPKVVTEVVSQLEMCKSNQDFASADLSSVSADTDGDGLSDRMECYAETNPIKSDTDGDGCSDYEELNNYFTNPLEKDCTVQSKVETFSDILISDPQPGWILSTKQPEISGKVPSNTVLVLVIATQSEQPGISALLKSIDAVLNLTDESSKEDISSAISDLNEQKGKMQEYLKTYSADFNSEPLSEAVNSIPDNLSNGNLSNEKNRDVLLKSKTLLENLKAKSVVAMASTGLKDTKIGEFDAKNFEEISNVLKDKQLYDIVATAYLADGSQISSKAVRFSIDMATTINKPIPMTIGGKLIPKPTAFRDSLFAGKAFAQENGGVQEIVIDQERPTITGTTEFGSQVFAIWNSVVLASSVISDSEQGAFEVQAPRNLEVGIPHRVTLYAVKTEDNNKIRSESVDVYFTIKAPGGGYKTLYIIIATCSLLTVVFIILRKELQKRRAMMLFKKAK